MAVLFFANIGAGGETCDGAGKVKGVKVFFMSNESTLQCEKQMTVESCLTNVMDK